MMEAHGTAEVDPSLQSREVERGLEGVLAVSSHLHDVLGERHLLQIRSLVAFCLLWKERVSLIEETGLAICSLQGDLLFLLRPHRMLRSPGDEYLIRLGFDVKFLQDVSC